MGKRCLSNVRRTAPLTTKQVKYTKTQGKAEKSKESSPWKKIFPPFGNVTLTGGRNSEFVSKYDKKVSSPKKLSSKPSISIIRHSAVFKSPFKAVKHDNLIASKSQPSTSSAPKLSLRSGQSVEVLKATRPKAITTVKGDQVESTTIETDLKDVVAGCETGKQNNKVLKREVQSCGEIFVEMQGTVNNSSVNHSSASFSVDKSCLNEAETSSTCIKSSKQEYALKKSMQDEVDPLQNADRPALGKGCQLNKRRNMLSLSKKCVNKENVNLTENKRNTGKQHTTSDGYHIIHENCSNSHKDKKHVSVCPEQFHGNLEIPSQTETYILQTVSPDLDYQERINETSSNSVCQSVVLNRNFGNLFSRKTTKLSQGSFPVGNRSAKIRAGNIALHSCARTMACTRLVSRNRDMEDFELKTSFNQFKSKMKSKN